MESPMKLPHQERSAPRHFAFIGLALFLTGCGTTPVSEAEKVPTIQNFTVGPWTNRYQGDPTLAGVVVQQFPDCGAEAPEYEGQHPAMILFVFKDGRVNQNGFEPDGKVREDFWWKLKDGDALWKDVRMPPTSTATRPAAQDH
jgi:hypothetical protein